jgi:methyltransferase
MVTAVLYLALLGAVAVERLIELAVSARHVRSALARGAIEHGRAHYPAMVAVHALFLPACAAEVLLLHRPFPGWLGLAMLVCVISAQALRWWAVLTLGDRWSTRILVFPGRPPVTSGPYRYLRHPNYLAVVIEMACLPLVHGAVATALLFSLLNAALLSVRIRDEERALGGAYARTFARTRRLWPRVV